MIDEKAAVSIATEYLRVKGVDVGGFAEARFLSDEMVWACCFFNKMPAGGIDCPGMTIVDVNSESGVASLFESL
jgi:hypothetical protein